VTLARAGHKVYATMRNPARGTSEITSIAEAEKLPLTVLPLDVDSDQSVREVFAKTGAVDVLRNGTLITDMSEHPWTTGHGCIQYQGGTWMYRRIRIKAE